MVTVPNRTMLLLVAAVAVLVVACAGAPRIEVYEKLDATESQANQVVVAAVGAERLGVWERFESSADGLLCSGCCQTVSEMRLNGVFGPGDDLVGIFTRAVEASGGTASPMGPEGLRVELGVDAYDIEIRWDGFSDLSVVVWIITEPFDPS
jgi:hypothetical protein